MDDLAFIYTFLHMSLHRLAPSFPLKSLRITLPLRHYLCTPEWRCDLQMKDYDLWLVSKGRGFVSIDGRKRELVPPEALLFRPGQRVEGRHDPQCPLEVWSLHFSPEKGEESKMGKIANACHGVTLRDAGSVRNLLEVFLAQSRYGDALLKQQSEMFALALLSVLWRQAHQPIPTPFDQLIEELIQNIRAQPAQDWTLTKMIRRVGVASTYLTKRFHRMTGRSPAQFVIHTRVEHAGMLLRETSLSLKQITQLSGYRDIYFFSRQFKKVQGIPPAAFRRQT